MEESPRLTRWDAERANAWYTQQPWLVGANYLPATAINAIEMWAEETFDPEQIERELGWAQSIGFNSLRVFLHEIPYFADPEGFLSRVDQFLTIAEKHGIGAMIVFFDSVWHPFPHPGKQPDPEPGVHNSGWVQSPGVAVLRDSERFDKLEEYVTTVVTRFKDDARVQIWDIWNEPCNDNGGSYGPRDLGNPGKEKVVLPLIAKAFDWVHAVAPTQPVTAGVWRGGLVRDTPTPMETLCLAASDVISFHCYSNPTETKKWLEAVQSHSEGRPIFCTEYMARSVDSRFENILPIFKEARVGAYCWGFVAGKSQTNYAWDSWQSPYGPEPPLWFHDIFRKDGTPYREEEVAFLRSITA